MPITKLLALPLLAVALGSTSLLAQNHISSSGRPPAHGTHVVTGGSRQAVGVFGDSMHRRAFHRTPFFYGAPFYYDYEPYEPEYQEPPPAPPAPVVEAKPEPLPDPVLLELRGNQWVKVTNFGEASEQALGTESAALTPPQKEMPPAVLVYRDGHSEEVSNYSIIGRVMYTKSDYWTSGAWTRTIQIADLNIPETIEKNRERGITFELPSSPDEIMLRP